MCAFKIIISLSQSSHKVAHTTQSQALIKVKANQRSTRCAIAKLSLSRGCPGRITGYLNFQLESPPPSH
jgi:hypothetical protein